VTSSQLMATTAARGSEEPESGAAPSSARGASPAAGVCTGVSAGSGGERAACGKASAPAPASACTGVALRAESSGYLRRPSAMARSRDSPPAPPGVPSPPASAPAAGVAGARAARSENADAGGETASAAAAAGASPTAPAPSEPFPSTPLEPLLSAPLEPLLPTPSAASSSSSSPTPSSSCPCSPSASAARAAAASASAASSAASASAAAAMPLASMRGYPARCQCASISRTPWMAPARRSASLSSRNNSSCACSPARQQCARVSFARRAGRGQGWLGLAQGVAPDSLNACFTPHGVASFLKNILLEDKDHALCGGQTSRFQNMLRAAAPAAPGCRRRGL